MSENIAVLTINKPIELLKQYLIGPYYAGPNFSSAPNSPALIPPPAKLGIRQLEQCFPPLEEAQVLFFCLVYFRIAQVPNTTFSLFLLCTKVNSKSLHSKTSRDRASNKEK